MSEPGGAPSSSELASARPAFVPEVRRVRPAPATRFFGPTAAVGVVVGGILVWHLAPPAREPVALEPVIESRAVDAVPVAPAVEAASVEPAPEVEVEPSSSTPSGAPLPNELVARALVATEESAAEPEAERADEPEEDTAEDEPAAEPAMGRLFVMVSGGSADLYVDGEPIGMAPTAVHVPAGRHVVRAVPPGEAAEQTMTVTVRPRETTHLRIALDPPPPGRSSGDDIGDIVMGPAEPPSSAGSPAPRSTDAPFVPPSAPPEDEGRYDVARACAIGGDFSCVIRELRGRCTQAREFELLIASMRALGGYSREVERAMREYQLRFPTGRQAAPYRLYLIEHGASVE